MAYNILQFLHVLSMFAAVAVALLSEVALHVIGRSGNVDGIRGFMSALGPLMRLTPVFFVVGLVLGLAAAVVGDVDLLAPWLVASYIVFAVAMGVGGLVGGPWAERVATAAAASPVESPSPELHAAVHDARGMLASSVLMTAIVVVIFLMVVKPG